MKDGKTVGAMKSTIGVFFGVMLCLFMMCAGCMVCIGVGSNIEKRSEK